jgi:hypothetical protein
VQAAGLHRGKGRVSSLELTVQTSCLPSTFAAQDTVTDIYTVFSVR